jgi:hypothetical protein
VDANHVLLHAHPKEQQRGIDSKVGGAGAPCSGSCSRAEQLMTQGIRRGVGRSGRLASLLGMVRGIGATALTAAPCAWPTTPTPSRCSERAGDEHVAVLRARAHDKWSRSRSLGTLMGP